ncbi:MAG: Maf family protein [Victivallales bacterium]|nr:Maf family protein [Victivallales bacterium]
MQIILASNSERRKLLLNKMGLDFIQVPSSVTELSNEIHYTEVATTNALRKAQDIAKKYPDSLVIGADTVIEYQHKIIGKPKNLSDAKNILLKLSNASHFVVSAVSLQSLSTKTNSTFAVRTKVHFKAFTADVVDEYLSLVEVLDKAGAYAIQEHGEMLIDFIEGSLDNVIGLPCEALREALDAVNIYTE